MRVVVLVLLSLLAVGTAANAQQTATRFEITNVGDSTFSFDIGDQHWVAPRLKGIAVDPRRRDALVARYQVLTVSNRVATALVTGETTRLTVQHVALLQRPEPRWYQDALMWAGALVGVVVGVIAGR